MDSVGGELIAVVLAGLIAVAIAMLIHRRLPDRIAADLKEHSGMLTGVAGTLFAITAGLLIASTWSAIGTASANAHSEADSLADLIWYAHTLPRPAQDKTLVLVRRYSQQVIADDWPLMNKTGTLSQPAWDTLDELHSDLLSLDPAKPSDVSRYQAALSAFRSVYHARMTRDQEAGSSLPGILWLGLIIAASITLLTPVIVSSSTRWVHAGVAFAGAAVVVFVLLMISNFNHAFSGSISVKPTMFSSDAVGLRNIKSWPVSQDRYLSRLPASPSALPASPSALPGG